MQSLDLKSRIKETIRNRPSATRGEVRARVSASLLAGYGASLLLFVGVGAVRVGPRPLVMVAGAAIGTALVASLASWAAIGRGDEMSGRSARALAWTAAITPLAILGWRLIWDAQFAPIGWHTLGLRCFALVILFALGPLAALYFLRRGVDPVHPRLLGAALAVAGGPMATCSSTSGARRRSRVSAPYVDTMPIVRLIIKDGRVERAVLLDPEANETLIRCVEAAAMRETNVPAAFGSRRIVHVIFPPPKSL